MLRRDTGVLYWSGARLGGPQHSKGGVREDVVHYLHDFIYSTRQHSIKTDHEGGSHARSTVT